MKINEIIRKEPRGEAAIRLSMYQVIAMNPVLGCLGENPHFQHLCKRLEEYSRMDK